MGKTVYKEIYDFALIDELKQGKVILVCDRVEREVYVVNDVEVSVLIDILNHDNSDRRYDFYTEEKE